MQVIEISHELLEEILISLRAYGGSAVADTIKKLEDVKDASNNLVQQSRSSSRHAFVGYLSNFEM